MKSFGINLVLSVAFVTTFFSLGVPPSLEAKLPWGGFSVFMIAGIYALTLGVILTPIVLRTKNYWNNIFFLSSCIINAIFAVVGFLMLFYQSAEKYRTIFIIDFIVFSLLAFFQIRLLMKLVKENVKSEKK